MNDLKELEKIMSDLRDNEIVAGSNLDLLPHAIQIQRNRILSKSMLIDWHDTPQSIPYKKSVIDGLAIVNEQGFTEISRKLDDIIMK